MIRSNTRKHVEQAIKKAKSLPYVRNVSKLHFNADEIFVDIDFILNLPSSRKVHGETTKGVRGVEKVSCYFSSQFPYIAPIFVLRKDFNKNFPHIFPRLKNGCPIPCIYDGDPTELLLGSGGDVVKIFDQMYDWLCKAVTDELMNLQQGWEPIRRNGIDSMININSANIRDIANGDQGFGFLKFSYFMFDEWFYGRIHDGFINLDNQASTTIFKKSNIADDVKFYESISLVVWCPNPSPGIVENGKKYTLDIVNDISSLEEIAKFYGCLENFLSAMKELQSNISGYDSPMILNIVIILLVERPCNLIDADSPIEILPYAMQIEIPNFNTSQDTRPVEPLGLVERMNSKILAEISGTKESILSSCVLIGAGSLGSKIALHFARAGHAPKAVIDKSSMLPHNLARHALLSEKYSKVTELSLAIEKLGQKTLSIKNDARNVLKMKQIRSLWDSEPKILINTTASFAVSQAMYSSKQLSDIKIYDGSLFSAGKVGLLVAEGENRNPQITDLMNEFYRIAYEDDSICELIFARYSSEHNQAIGQGCSSRTMIMSDSRLSLMAAGMSEYFLKKSMPFPPEGEILFGTLDNNELGVTWVNYIMDAVEVLSTADNFNDKWEIRVHKYALDKMEKEYLKHNLVETGGVLVGRISETNKIFHVVDVLDAPPDSKKEPTEFILGIEGLEEKKKEYAIKTDGTLYFLGTWHSHLGKSTPSKTDRDTAKEKAKQQDYPLLLLILGTDGYQALVHQS